MFKVSSRGTATLCTMLVLLSEAKVVKVERKHSHGWAEAASMADMEGEACSWHEWEPPNVEASTYLLQKDLKLSHKSPKLQDAAGTMGKVESTESSKPPLFLVQRREASKFLARHTFISNNGTLHLLTLLGILMLLGVLGLTVATEMTRKDEAHPVPIGHPKPDDTDVETQQMTTYSSPPMVHTTSSSPALSTTNQPQQVTTYSSPVVYTTSMPQQMATVSRPVAYTAGQRSLSPTSRPVVYTAGQSPPSPTYSRSVVYTAGQSQPSPIYSSPAVFTANTYFNGY